MRLVMAKKSDEPCTTTHRVSMPRPRALARRVWSSSATPPPVAVEFTLSTMWPCNRDRMASAVASSLAVRSGPITASR